MSGTVVIAGAGPAGLMLAIELRLANVETVVIERSPAPNEHTIGGTLHARTIDLFEQRGMADAVRAVNAPVWPRLHFAGFWLNMEPLLSEEYSLLLPQLFTEQIIEQRATALGVEIRRGHKLVGLRQDESGVHVSVQATTGDYELRAAYLVGCDGAHSTVRALGGFAVKESRPSWYGLLADVSSIEGDWHPGFYPKGQFAVIPPPFPGAPSRLMTLEFDTDAPADDEPVTVEEVQSSVKRITGRAPVLGETIWLHRYTNITRDVENYRNGRVFLVGDAAHLYLSFSSSGLNTALHDAANLGWKLAAEINGWAPEGLLDTYNTERRPVGHRACVNTLAQMALQAEGDKFDALREIFSGIAGFSDVSRYLIKWHTDVRYEMGADGDTHPLAGRPVPNLAIKADDGQVTVAEALRSGRGVLLNLAARPCEAASGWADRVDVVAGRPVKSPSDVAADLVLVRPDGFVAWAGDGNDTAEDGLRNTLARWFGSARS